MFLLYSDADVHTLIACVRDALEQQNSGTAVNDRYMKLTFTIDGTSVESWPCTVNSLIATTSRDHFVNNRFVSQSNTVQKAPS